MWVLPTFVDSCPPDLQFLIGQAITLWLSVSYKNTGVCEIRTLTLQYGKIWNDHRWRLVDMMIDEMIAINPKSSMMSEFEMTTTCQK